MRQLKYLVTPLLVVAIAVGCDNDSPTDPIVEEPEPVPTVTDTFTGNFALGETSCHVFTSVNAGLANLTITGLAPLETLTVGLGLGVDDDDPETACAYFAADQSVRVDEVLQSQLSEATTYCVCVFDVGNVFPDQTVDYTLVVRHP